MTSPIAEGLLAGLGVALPVGAVGTYLVGLAARERPPVAYGAALGVAATDAVYALVATSFRSSLGRGLGGFVRPATDVASGVLLILAVRVLVVAARRYRSAGVDTTLTQADRSSAVRAFLRLFLLTALNPSTVVSFLAVAVASDSGSGPTWTVDAEFTAGVWAASASWQMMLATGGRLLGSYVTGARGQLILGVCSATVVAVIAGRTFV